MTRSRRRKLQPHRAAARIVRVADWRIRRRVAHWSAGACGACASAADAERARAASKRSSSPRRSAPRTCRTCRSASRCSAREKLEQLHVTELRRLREVLPSVCPYQTRRPGLVAHLHARRGSGGDGNHSGSLPSVGMYLDEQPITTIDGALDIHIYDIERVEALRARRARCTARAPQAGTMRIITNKPDPTEFEAGYDARGQHGRPRRHRLHRRRLRQHAAQPTTRPCAWSAGTEHDAGYIDNVAGHERQRRHRQWRAHLPDVGRLPSTITALPGRLGVVGAGADQQRRLQSRRLQHRRHLRRARRAKFDLGDNWTVTPTVMGQSERTEGFFGYDPAVGDCRSAHFGPNTPRDSGGRRRSRSKARSAISISSMRAPS